METITNKTTKKDMLNILKKKYYITKGLSKKTKEELLNLIQEKHKLEIEEEESYKSFIKTYRPCSHSYHHFEYCYDYRNCDDVPRKVLLDYLDSHHLITIEPLKHKTREELKIIIKKKLREQLNKCRYEARKARKILKIMEGI